MKVFIVTAKSWDDSVRNTGEAFFNESDAASFVDERNAKATSSYHTKYDYEEVEVK